MKTGNKDKKPCVYIVSNIQNGTIYIGVTSNLHQRIWQHQNEKIEGFTKINKLHRLIYYEWHNNMDAAIQREKEMKKWNRAWKLKLINKFNPDWRDLSKEIK